MSKEVGSFIHTIWTCAHIQDFWVKVVSKLNLVFNKELDLDPVGLLLGIYLFIPHVLRCLLHIDRLPQHS